MNARGRLTAAGVAGLDALLQPTYARLVISDRRPLSFRLRNVASILDRARQVANATRLVVDAQVYRAPVTAASAEPAGAHDAPPPTLSVVTPEGAMVFQFLRVFDSRFWSIDIRPLDGEVRAVYREAIWGQLVSGLISDLKSLGKIEARFVLRDVDPNMQVVTDRRAETFERLIVDVLREERISARLAPLHEDFLEKTDLRVQVPGLDRNRGARVQVTLITNVDLLRDKIARIRVADELVLLSPRTLAESLSERPDDSDFEKEEADAALRVLGANQNSPDRVARSLLVLFLDALDRIGDDVRGPVALIPPPIRRLVGRFVTREAKRSTQALRVRESVRRRTLDTTPDMPADPASSIDGELPAQVVELLGNLDQIHPVGSRAFGRVVGLSKHGASLILDSGIQAFLHNSEVSWTEQHPKASDSFAIGDRVEVILQGVEAGRRWITASYRSTLENPWSSFAEQFPVGIETSARVKNVLRYGLFAELPNRCVGLLHVSKLIAPIESYYVGALLTVRVVDFDPEGRRIALAEVHQRDSGHTAVADDLVSASPRQDDDRTDSSPIVSTPEQRDSMSETNKAILKEANAAIVEGNNEGFLAFCSDDTTWTFVGDKTLKGKEAVRRWMATTYTEPPKFAVAEMIAADDLVVALGNITTEGEDGKAVQSSYCDVWRFRDGKMVELRAFVIQSENEDEAGRLTPETDLLRAAYAAFNARDIDAALATMSPSVAWPKAFKGGFARGHHEVRAYWTEQWSEIDPHVEPVSFRPKEAGRILVEVNQVVRDLAGSLLGDERVGHRFTIENGLIQAMEVCSPPQSDGV